jgi:peptidoglycan glycosyltransferase
LTLAAAFAAGCPAPFDELAHDFDVETITKAVQRWQLDAATASFKQPVHRSGFSPAVLTTTQSLRELILGQGALTVSPLQMAFMMGAIANGGQPIASPHLTFTSASTSSAPLVVSPEVAGAIQSALSTHDDLGGQIALAVSGENQLTWFLGFAPALSPRWAIVVLLEGGDAATCYQIAASTRAKLSP